MKDFDQIHHSVFAHEVIKYLRPKIGDVFVDGTLGLAGHGLSIVERIKPEGMLIGIDQDQDALKLAQERLKGFEKNCRFINDNFRNISNILKDLNIDLIHGVLLDLGVSSLQLDTAERGFSFRHCAPLDMRMNQNQKRSAFDIVNMYSKDELSQMIKDLGEERWHKRIAERIVLQRAKGEIETTEELSEIIVNALPKGRTREKIHPATRTFQALRIKVNDELGSLEQGINDCIEHLAPGGRIGVISFHSLEDRIVKLKFRDLVKEEKVKLIVKKPVLPTEEEKEENPRARSAKFRIAQRL